MTGDEFRDAMKSLGLTQETLAQHWDLARTTVGAQCRKDEVSPVFADAMSFLLIDDRLRTVGSARHGKKQRKENH